MGAWAALGRYAGLVVMGGREHSWVRHSHGVYAEGHLVFKLLI